jgi:DNA-binding MarR family transcriptional regulator
MSNSDSFEILEFLPYLLNQASDASSLDFQRYYKAKYGMLRTEWRVLFHLGRYGNLTAKSICDLARIHKTKVSRAVSALEEKRFLDRSELEEDRRHEVLSLTDAGRAAYRDLSAEAHRFQTNLMSDIEPEDRAVLLSCLRQIAGFEHSQA